ncbi:MAG: extracellular solute-binding protein [Candidatus Weimeria sp.]
MKRVFSSALLAVFLLVSVTGAIKSFNSTSDSGQKEKTVTLTWYVNFSWFKADWGRNLVSKTITEKTGVNVKFISPVSDDDTQLNTMIESASLSDLVTLDHSDSACNEMIRNGDVYSYTDLADQYAPEFYDVADPNVLSWYRKSDGRIYEYPSGAVSPKDISNNHNIASNETFLVRKDIYEAIGSPDMSTPEGFINAVRKAEKYFPVVENGEPLIPVGTSVFDGNGCYSLDRYLQDFLAVPYEKDGSYYDRNTDPEYIRWLKVFRQLQSEGLVSQENFVNGRTQISENFENGRYFCIFYQRTDFSDQQMDRYKNDPDSVYIAVDGPENSNGDDPKLPNNSMDGWTVTMVSKNCRHLKETMKLIDFLLSEEGQKLTYLGVEGKTWENTKEGPRFYPEVRDMLVNDKDMFNQKYGADYMYWMLMNNVMSLKWKQPMSEPLLQMEEWTYPYTVYLGEYEINFPDNTRLGHEYSQIKKLWGDTLPRLLLAGSDDELDSIMKDYQEKRDKLGYAEIQKEETRQMNEKKRRLSIIQ